MIDLESKGICLINNSTTNNPTKINITNPSVHTNKSVNPGDILKQLTQSWISHTAICLGVQSFGKITSCNYVSKHLGKAITSLSNELSKSQELIAHFLIFNSASLQLQKHVQEIMTYIQTLTK